MQRFKILDTDLKTVPEGMKSLITAMDKKPPLHWRYCPKPISIPDIIKKAEKSLERKGVAPSAMPKCKLVWRKKGPKKGPNGTKTADVLEFEAERTTAGWFVTNVKAAKVRAADKPADQLTIHLSLPATKAIERKAFDGMIKAEPAPLSYRKKTGKAQR